MEGLVPQWYFSWITASVPFIFSDHCCSLQHCAQIKVGQIGDAEGEAMGSCSDWDDILDQETFKLSQESKKMDQAEGLRSSSDDEDSSHHATKRRRCNQTMTGTEPTGTEEVLGCREAQVDQPWWVSLIEAHISSSSILAATATNPQTPQTQTKRRVKVLSSCTGTCAEGAVLEAGSGNFSSWGIISIHSSM